MKIWVLIAFACHVNTEFVDKVSYEGYKVYRVTPRTKDHIQTLMDLRDQHVHFWKGPYPVIGRSSDLMLSPNDTFRLFTNLKESGLEISEFIPNVQELIDEETIYKGPKTNKLTWDKYYGLDDIYAYMDSLEESFKNDENLNVKSVTIGKTYENRDIKVLTISKPSADGSKKPSIFMDANIHAREWITGMVLTRCIEQLVNYQSDPSSKEMIDNYDFKFLSIVNPDGFHYSHTRDRLWRKTRSVTANPKCIGADPNRNFDYHWMEGGASNDSCTEIYAGSQPFSEPCTRAFRDYITNLSEKPKMYISLHSYSQLILLPYGYTYEKFGHYDEHMRLASKAIEAHAAPYGTAFEAGIIPEVLYVASGSSMDWMLGEKHSDYAFTYELRDTGNYGFVLPASQIDPSFKEFWLGFCEIAREITSKKNLK